MKRLALLVFLASALHAQSHRFPPIDLYTGDPTGVACSVANSIVQSTTTGGVYACLGSVYKSVATGASAGAAGTNTQAQFNCSGVFCGSLATLDGSGNFSTPGTVQAPIIGAVAVVANYPGANADLKLAAAQTAAAGQPVMFQVNQATGTAFANAITLAAGQGLEFAQQGTYTLSGVTLGAGSKIVCDVPGTTLIASGALAALITQANGSSIAGCTLDGGGFATPVIAATSVSNVTVQNSTIQNTLNAKGISLSSVSGFAITNNTFLNVQGDNILVIGNSDGRIVSNKFDSTSGTINFKAISLHSQTAGQQIHNVVVADNIISGNGYFGIEVGAFVALTPLNIVISHNTIWQTGVAPNGHTGGISCDSCVATTINGNNYFNLTAVAANPATLELVMGRGNVVTGNSLWGGQVTINKESYTEFSGNYIVGLFGTLPSNALLKISTSGVGENVDYNNIHDNILDRTGIGVTASWPTSTAVGKGLIIRDSNGNLQMVVGGPGGPNAGLTGGSPPTWATTRGTTPSYTVDNQVVWQLLSPSITSGVTTHGIWFQCNEATADCSHNTISRNKIFDDGNSTGNALQIEADAGTASHNEWTFNDIYGWTNCYGFLNFIGTTGNAIRLNRDSACATLFSAGSAANVSSYIPWTELSALTPSRNLVSNSSFDGPEPGNYWVAGTGTMTVTTAAGFITHDNALTYTGTGAAAPTTYWKSAPITVTAGSTYTLSASIDSTNVTLCGGSSCPDVSIWKADLSAKLGAGVVSTVGGAARGQFVETIPGGVTSVVIRVDTELSTVTNAAPVYFSDIQLEAGTSATQYKNNPLGIGGTIPAGFLPTGANVVATIDRTGLTNNTGTVLLYAVPSNAAGWYRVSCYAVVTTAAGSSSTLPACVITWSDKETGVTSTGTFSSTSTVNSVGATNSAAQNRNSGSVYAAASTNINYGTGSGYASNPANAMTYSLHIKVEYIGP